MATSIPDFLNFPTFRHARPDEDAFLRELRQNDFRQRMQRGDPAVVAPQVQDTRAIHEMTIVLRFPYESAAGEMPTGEEDFFKLPQVEWFLRVLVNDGKSFTGPGEWEALITSMYESRKRPGNIAGISALYTYSQYMDCHELRFSPDRDIRHRVFIIHVSFKGKEKADAILSAPAKVLIPAEVSEPKPRRMNMRKGLRGAPE